MLTYYGVPFLRWLDETALPVAHASFHGFWNYVHLWRETLDV